ncbi:MAG: rhomboid family intramembrane serine protease [Lachnospiraceae bacterium]|nr:rhomboid family intramembrane serine protease [Lachnospiraceae bacterium]
MIELLSSFLLLEGFTPVSTNLENYKIFLRKETGHITALFAYETRYGEMPAPETYQSLRDGSLRLLREKNLEEIHSLFVVLTANPQMGLTVTQGDRNAWVIDTNTRGLYIAPDRVEDFYGFKGKLSDFLKDPGRAQATIAQVQTNLNRSVQERQRAQTRTAVNVFPWVTLIIILANLLVGGFCMMYGDYATSLLDLDPVAVLEKGQWYRLFTYMYVHGGVTHYVNNMIMLYMAGQILEPSLGRGRYVLLYHLLGVIAGAGSLLYKVVVGSTIPSVGASGAIMGVLGILLYISLRNLKNIGRGRYYRIFMLSLCAIDSVYQGFAVPGVDNAAHVTGIVAGVIAGLILESILRSKQKKQGRR